MNARTQGRRATCGVGLAALSALGLFHYVRARNRRAVEERGFDADFAAIVSHELRAPLSPIAGWASTLLQCGDSLGPDERRAALQSILAQAQHPERPTTGL